MENKEQADVVIENTIIAAPAAEPAHAMPDGGQAVVSEPTGEAAHASIADEPAGYNGPMHAALVHAAPEAAQETELEALKAASAMQSAQMSQLLLRLDKLVAAKKSEARYRVFKYITTVLLVLIMLALVLGLQFLGVQAVAELSTVAQSANTAISNIEPVIQYLNDFTKSVDLNNLHALMEKIEEVSNTIDVAKIQSVFDALDPQVLNNVMASFNALSNTINNVSSVFDSIFSFAR